MPSLENRNFSSVGLVAEVLPKIAVLQNLCILSIRAWFSW